MTVTDRSIHCTKILLQKFQMVRRTVAMVIS